MHEKEAGDGNHPIDRLSRHHAHFSMKHVMGKNRIMLDVGCSSGFLLSENRGRYPHGHLIGADYFPEVVSRCAEKIQVSPCYNSTFGRVRLMTTA